MKKNLSKCAALLLIPFILTSCDKNPDAASIRQAYVEEKRIEKSIKEAERKAGEQADNTKEGVLQAGEDIKTAAGIEAANLQNETETFFGWFFDDINGRWEYTKKLLETPASEIHDVIGHENDYIPGEDEYRTGDPAETGISYLEKSRTAENVQDAMESIQDTEKKAVDTVRSIEEDTKDSSTAAGSAIGEAAGSASEKLSDVQNAVTNGMETLSGKIPESYSFEVADFSGAPYEVINNNKPFFTEQELSQTEPRITLTELDALGRCGQATELIDYRSLPKEPRGEIGMVKPSGWNQAKYDTLKCEENPAGYLYARCHLLAYCLSGLNAEPRNLITGTLTQFNVIGMEPFELQTLYYVKGTRNHVLYRVTPLFKGANLVADGVLMEAQSIEDSGLSFCVFVYNVPQAGSRVKIDYFTGKSYME